MAHIGLSRRRRLTAIGVLAAPLAARRMDRSRDRLGGRHRALDGGAPEHRAQVLPDRRGERTSPPEGFGFHCGHDLRPPGRLRQDHREPGRRRLCRCVGGRQARRREVVAVERRARHPVHASGERTEVRDEQPLLRQDAPLRRRRRRRQSERARLPRRTRDSVRRSAIDDHDHQAEEHADDQTRNDSHHEARHADDETGIDSDDRTAARTEHAAGAQRGCGCSERKRRGDAVTFRRGGVDQRSRRPRQ